MNLILFKIYKILILRKNSNNKDYDILFIIDSTQSKDPTVSSVSKYVMEIVNKTKSKYPDYNIKYGAIYYRDEVCSWRPLYKDLDFTDDMTLLQNYVDRQIASHGGDAPEDWPSAYLKTLNDLHWRNGIKTILHFCDYGTHGVGFTNENDTYPEDDRMYNIVERLCDMKNLYIKGFAILNDAKIAFNKMNEICIERRIKME